MAVYQDKALERVSKGLRKYKTVAQKARANNAQESDTRMIVSAFVSDALGWDAFDCVFRSKPISDSAPSRSLIPEQADHPYRSQADHFGPTERNRA
jgi:hypothetical protein